MQHCLLFGRCQLRLQIFSGQIRGQMQRVQYQRGGFVNGVVGAVAKVQTGCVHLAGAPADQVAQGA